MNDRTASTGEAPPDKSQHTRARPLRWLLRGLAVSVPLLLVALLIYGVVAQNPSTTIDDSVSRGRPITAPAFRLAVLQPGTLEGLLQPTLSSVFSQRVAALGQLRGIPVVLNFWASWCVPCQEEAPTLERSWRQLARPRGAVFLGLDMQDVTGDARAFMRHYGIDYPNVRDPTNSVARTYGVTGVPETFFIDSQGKIVGHIIGLSTGKQLAQGIAAAQSGHVVRSFQSGAQGALR